MIDINLTQTSNITLKTKDKYCKDDIQIVQNLEEQIANPSEQTQEFTPSVGKNGISKFTINPIVTENVSVKSTEENQVVSASEGKYIKTINVNKINLENKTIVPTKERQTVVASQGYDGLKSTNVEPIPDDYIIPEGTLNINENGSYNVKDKESVNVAVPGEVVNLQDKTVTPTKEVQNVTADQGYTGLGTVEVGAIPNEYIIPEGNINVTENNQVVDVTQYSQATISVPTGEEDLIGSMMMGVPVDYVDTQGSVTFVSQRAMMGVNQFLNSIELPRCSYIGSFAFAQSYFASSSYQSYMGITKVSIPSCSLISSVAFQSCFRLSNIYMPLVEEIGSYCFRTCFSLSQLDAPLLNTVGSYAFMYCRLTSINAPNLQYVDERAFAYTSVSELSVPNFTTAKSFGFAEMTSLISFYAPNLSKLSAGLFRGCSNLVDINIDYDNISNIANGCFVNCYSLSRFMASNCTNIEPYAFSSCKMLSMINMPLVTSVGNYAFTSCSALESISFPQCTYLGSSAFNRCSSLKEVYLPKASMVAQAAFAYCSSLTDVTLTECTLIESLAFRDCNNLGKISLPNISAIYPSTFSNCSTLSTLILLSTSIVRLSNSNAFNSTPFQNSTYLGYFGSIYVPTDLVDSYKTSTNWTYFSDRITSIDNLPTT